MSNLIWGASRRILDDNGDPVSGGKIIVYTAGTTTAVTTYSDQALSSANSSPVVADAAGVAGPIFVADGSYKVRVTDAADVVLYEDDYVETLNNQGVKHTFDTVTTMIADTLTYTYFTEDDYVKAGQFVYQVAASGASDSDVTTAGSVKLYLREGRVSPYALKGTGYLRHETLAGDQTSDVTAFFDYFKAQAKRTYPGVDVWNVLGGDIDRVYRCTSAIDATIMRDGIGTDISGLLIESHASDGVAIDMSGWLYDNAANFSVVGDATDVPKYGYQIARHADSGVTGQAIFTGFRFHGSATAAGLFLHNVTRITFRGGHFQNRLVTERTQTACEVATTANITLSGEQTIDDVLTSTDRVLVKDQTDASENGIYVSAAGAWARATDADASAEINGLSVSITSGTANGGDRYVASVADPTTFVIGTDDITWTDKTLTLQQRAFPIVVDAGGSSFFAPIDGFVGTIPTASKASERIEFVDCFVYKTPTVLGDGIYLRGSAAFRFHGKINVDGGSAVVMAMDTGYTNRTIDLDISFEADDTTPGTILKFEGAAQATEKLLNPQIVLSEHAGVSSILAQDGTAGRVYELQGGKIHAQTTTGAVTLLLCDDVSKYRINGTELMLPTRTALGNVRDYDLFMPSRVYLHDENKWLEFCVTATTTAAAGTDGGGATSGSWETRTLDALDDPSSLAAISAGGVQLPAGDWIVTARAAAYRVNAHRIRIYDTTNTTVLAQGQQADSNSTDGDMTYAHVAEKVVTVPKGATVLVQHQVETTKATDGYGKAVSIGSVSQEYVSVTFRRAATA